MEEKSCVTKILEDTVRSNLNKMGFDFSSKLKIGVAVSGGADSIALLTSLVRIIDNNFSIKVITVNHNIRPAEQTEGDACFVQDYCNRIGVECFRVDIPRGKVEEISRQFDCGMEDAARRLRYEAFEKIKTEKKLDYICLAHNKNDQVETVLMRFLSGADSSSLGGIPFKRGAYIRPLIEVTRKTIEEYLGFLKIGYRIDCTNFDTSMLRNKIRHKVIPLLDSEFPGWQNSVYSLSSKIKDDGEVIENLSVNALEKIHYKENGSCCSFFAQEFFSLPKSVRRRIVYKAVDFVGPNSRIPYHFIDRVCTGGDSDGGSWKINSSGIVAYMRDGRICVQKDVKQATESCFFVTIEGNGLYVAGDWRVLATECGSQMDLEIFKSGGKKSVISVPGLCFPFIFRSRQVDDEILTAKLSMRPVSKILEDWKCRGEDKDEVPVLQELSTVDQNLKGILGEVLGYRNWIVKS